MDVKFPFTVHSLYYNNKKSCIKEAILIQLIKNILLHPEIFKNFCSISNLPFIPSPVFK